MIQVESIVIREFRGIRDLKLDLNAKNFAVCGPNGTGKSGVVDALEFALTGSVSRLTGKGRGDISLIAHGPHVDKRAAPEKASVSVTLTIPSLKATVIIDRNLKSASKPRITPSSPAILKVLAEVQAHPEIVLSRREIIRYVLATPGDRAQEVQALLRLETLEKVRAGLLKIANACERELRPMRGAATAAKENLLRGLGIAELTQQKVLDAANRQRAVLGLAALTELRESTSLTDGMETPAPTRPQRIAKVQATSDLQHLRGLFEELRGESTAAEVGRAAEEVSKLLDDPAAANVVKRAQFYRTGADLIDAAACPFCDSSWDPGALRAHIREKIAHLDAIAEKGKAIEGLLAPLIERLRALASAVRVTCRYARLAIPVVPAEPLKLLAESFDQNIEKLTTLSRLSEAPAVLAAMTKISSNALDVVDQVQAYVSSLPEPTKQDAARVWLTVAQERLDVLREARRKVKAGEAKADRARKISDAFGATSDRVLAGLYATVQDDFVKLYRFINRDDEAAFQARLTPSMGKLGFDVDFYGRGYFPPGAYHSEGHQDGMGLCLYLALMRRVQGDEFRFAVLDDVLMSIDAGHRREVCALLKKEFPNTQFVMTTHDQIWLRHMRTEGLTGAHAAVQFRSWSVEHGPTRWDDRDVWTEIGESLANNDVRAAAGVLRNYLEFVSAELCHRLRARVEFRGDALYQLGELLPSAVGQLRNLFKKGKNAAGSWGQKPIVADLTKREKDFGELVEASNVERWQINAAIHFNAWENLGKNDFEPVVKAYSELVAAFACPDCGENLRVSPASTCVHNRPASGAPSLYA